MWTFSSNIPASGVCWQSGFRGEDGSVYISCEGFFAANDYGLKHSFILLWCKQRQSELVYLQTKMFRGKSFLGRHSKSSRWQIAMIFSFLFQWKNAKMKQLWSGGVSELVAGLRHWDQLWSWAQMGLLFPSLLMKKNDQCNTAIKSTEFPGEDSVQMASWYLFCFGNELFPRDFNIFIMWRMRLGSFQDSKIK